jgi:aspartate kinase
MMLSVEKIGGTSMSKMEAVLNNIVFHGQLAQVKNRVFVVSAYAGITNILLENRKTGEPGIYTAFCKGEACPPLLSALKEKLLQINSSYADLGLDLRAAGDFLDKRIAQVEHYLQSLSVVLASGYVPTENIYSAAREMLASIGEAHSAFNMNNMIMARGAISTLVDLSGFDDNQPMTIDERISHAFSAVNLEAGIAVATGYCKGTEGIMREFDRGYSDVTFSKVAVALKAGQAVIHKEYHLSTADPEIVGETNCRPVSRLNFDIADQLADIGMQAIHPKASKPLELSGIDLRIKNTFQPDHPGTVISVKIKPEEGKVDLISGSDKVFIFEIIDPLMVGAVGFDERIMGILKQFGVSYILKTTSANSISMVVFRKDISQAFMDTLRVQFMEVRAQECALITILGMSLKKTGILAQSAGLLASEQIGILSVGLAYSQVNLQLVVASDDYAPAIRVLHQGFFGQDEAKTGQKKIYA